MVVATQAEDDDMFSPSSLKRSHSQPKFNSKQARSFHSTSSPSSSPSRLDETFRDRYNGPVQIVPDSSPSSPPSSPPTFHAESVDQSYLSTPATNLSLDGHYEEDLELKPGGPEFDDSPFFAHLEDLEPPPSPGTGDSYTVSPTDHDTSANTSRPVSPYFIEHAEDDTAVKHQPTQHVDYLSHNWKEEDIWSSWRYITSKRGEFTNSQRLENASWRTWMKAKYSLRTVSPETLNWLKDCDVTWLYGPLQTGSTALYSTDAGRGSSTLSRCDSFARKKPILKKRSMSEVMLQKSLSSSSLLKQAAAAVQAQQKGHRVGNARPALQRATTDFVTYPFSSRGRSHQTSSETSGVVSPSAERKHIHFDEHVQQCIAVDLKGDEEEEEEVDHSGWGYDDSSDSDNGPIMMKLTKSPKKPVVSRKKTQVNPSTDSKTIAMLPSTTLKSRLDTPEPVETAMKHSSSSSRSPVLSPSSSQETLRPSKPSRAFREENEDDYMGDAFNDPSDVLFPDPDWSRAGNPEGMRRTDSGMFMPVEDGDARPNQGIVGRVIDTVNTARDIAHVVWNVGWRR
jgi:hypothetical protein